MKLESLCIAIQDDCSNGLAMACGHFRIACITSWERERVPLPNFVGKATEIFLFCCVLFIVDVAIQHSCAGVGRKHRIKITSIQIYHEFVCVYVVYIFLAVLLWKSHFAIAEVIVKRFA